MPSLNLNFGLSAFLNGAIQVAIILIGGVIGSLLIRMIIPKLIMKKCPGFEQRLKNS